MFQEHGLALIPHTTSNTTIDITPQSLMAGSDGCSFLGMFEDCGQGEGQGKDCVSSTLL